MLEQLIKFYEKCHKEKQSLQFTLTHDKIADWYCKIYHKDSQFVIFEDNDFSLNCLCAEAYLALENWARQFEELENIEINLI